jgi:pimeloyl-ACP methyl ester carboxylesterase
VGARGTIVAVLALAAWLTGCGAHKPFGRPRHPEPVRRAQLTGAHPCPDQPHFTCSTLSVPLDHAGQADGTLALAVGMSPADRAPHGEVLFLTGGPGQPGVPFLTRIQTRLRTELNGYRLVMFDQRGTGAGALACRGLQEAAGASDLTVVSPGTVAACAHSIGTDRRYYSTSETVTDIE